MMLAVARPMPLAAPVINATLPLNRIAFLPSLVVALARRISPAGQNAMLDRARPSRQQLHARRGGAVKPLPCAHSCSPAPAGFRTAGPLCELTTRAKARRPAFESRQ
jgi:hypothetical protein